MIPVIHWSDRWESPKGILPVVGTLIHTQELCGEDTLTFDTTGRPLKGDRLLWQDENGDLRRHVVVRTSMGLDGICEVYAEGCQCELLTCYVENRKVYGTADNAISIALADTRFGVGSAATVEGKSCWLYHTNALAAVNKVASSWGCEFLFRVSREDGVTKRHVDFLEEVGSDRGARFEYRLNLGGCVRTVLADEVCTALYGYGAGLAVLDEEGWTGGYHRKLTFGDVNWVGDDDAREVWGRWNADKTAKVHTFGEVTFSDCEDAEELLELTKAALAESVRPTPSLPLASNAGRTPPFPPIGRRLSSCCSCCPLRRGIYQSLLVGNNKNWGRARKKSNSRFLTSCGIVCSLAVLQPR